MLSNSTVNARQMLSDSKFYEAYARFNDEKNRYETWDEAVDRVMDMHKKRYAKAIKEYPELLEYIETATDAYKSKLVIGAQRALQFGGEQILKNNAKMYNCTSTYIDRPRAFAEVFWFSLSGSGVGFSVQKHHIEKLPELAERKKQPKTFIIEDSIEGWADALSVLLSSYFVGGGTHKEYEGRRVYFDTTNIRPKGSFISGGFKAPGPEPLRRALDKVEYLLQGLVLKGQKKLRPIDAYDILMHTVDAVLSGGVRRSATLCMFSKDDDEMMNAKTGNWFIDNPQRGRSNNSVVLVKSETTAEEFHEIMSKTKQFGEPGFIFVESTEHAYNPCLTGDSLVKVKDHDILSNGELIAEGIEYEIPISELKYKYDSFLENGGKIEQYMPLVLSKNLETGELEYKQILWAALTREKSDIIKIVLDDGKTIRCTPDHKIYTSNRGYVEAKDLTESDDIVTL